MTITTAMTTNDYSKTKKNDLGWAQTLARPQCNISSSKSNDGWRCTIINQDSFVSQRRTAKSWNHKSWKRPTKSEIKPAHQTGRSNRPPICALVLNTPLRWSFIANQSSDEWHNNQTHNSLCLTLVHHTREVLERHDTAFDCHNEQSRQPPRYSNP